MVSEGHKKFIKTKKTEYNNIGHILCPAFNNEKIYFNREGFNHLLWKGDSYRAVSEQQERLSLIPFAVSLLGMCGSYSTYRNSRTDENTAKFWAFDSMLGNKSVSVVVRQINEGNKHFLSVFYKT